MQHSGIFRCRKSTTWGPQFYFPSEGRSAEDFFALKNLMASAGFEPANLGCCVVTYLPVSHQHYRILGIDNNVILSASFTF
jgi:hypothetical protein